MATDDVHSRPPVLLHLPGFALSHLGRIVRAGIKDAFADEGLSARAHFVLLCLADEGELSQRELADRVAMDRSDLVKLLDELEQADQVRRSPDPRDRRRHLLSATPAGLRALKRGEHVVDRATDQVLVRLSAKERATLHRLVLRALGRQD